MTQILGLDLDNVGGGEKSVLDLKDDENDPMVGSDTDRHRGRMLRSTRVETRL